MLGVHCVVYAAVGAGGMLFGHWFPPHIPYSSAHQISPECSAQKINRHSITFICLLCLNSTDTIKIKVALLISFVHVFNITFPKW